jgi:glycosyltransferase involved in cell wall biosynthesis
MTSAKPAAPFIVVTSSFPIRNDGSEAAGSFVADLVGALAESVRVRVVAPGSEERRDRWADGIDVFRYAAPEQPLSTLKPWQPADLRWILRVIRSGATMTRMALGDDGGGILALWGLPCGEWARRAAAARRVPYSVWLLGSDVWSLGRVPILRGMLARVIRGATRAYADGYQLADHANRLSGRSIDFLPSTREVAPADASAPRAEAPYRLLFLGRWHPNKGIDLLLEALALLEDADWARIERIEIQGGGPLDTLVRERAQRLRAAGRPVEVGGFLDKTAAAAAFARSDWLVLPSRIESIPVVFSDAMKLGRPIVSTPIGDLPRLLAERDLGVLAEGVSAGALATALRTALASSAAARVDALRAAALPFSLRGSIVPAILDGR